MECKFVIMASRGLNTALVLKAVQDLKLPGQCFTIEADNNGLCYTPHPDNQDFHQELFDLCGLISAVVANRISLIVMRGSNKRQVGEWNQGKTVWKQWANPEKPETAEDLKGHLMAIGATPYPPLRSPQPQPVLG